MRLFSFGTGMSLSILFRYVCVVFWITGSCIAVATLSNFQDPLLYCRGALDCSSDQDRFIGQRRR